MTGRALERSEASLLVPVISLGTLLITSVATTFRVWLDSAQWTLTLALLSGAVATPWAGSQPGGHRPATILATPGDRRRRRCMEAPRASAQGK